MPDLALELILDMDASNVIYHFVIERNKEGIALENSIIYIKNTWSEVLVYTGPIFCWNVRLLLANLIKLLVDAPGRSWKDNVT